MKPDFFRNLPSEIITDILLRLSVRSIAISKCVCKSWLDLLEADGFVKSHFSKSAPALLVKMPARFEFLELEDKVDLESNDLRCDPLTKFVFPNAATVMPVIQGSANGLLLLKTYNYEHRILDVCNPINREVIKLPPPPQGYVCGLGASKITGQHKVVCISPRSLRKPESKCHVYTLGSGSWRRIEPCPTMYCYGSFGTFFNGNLHCIVNIKRLESYEIEAWICCFDLETECFSTFSAPPLRPGSSSWCLFTLSDCLCFCEESYDSMPYEVVIWMIKEYEVDKSWSEEYVIPLDGFKLVKPIKVFKNGDLLMLCEENRFMYYSKETRTTQEIGFFGARDDSNYVLELELLTPSLLSLKSLGSWIHIAVRFWVLVLCHLPIVLLPLVHLLMAISIGTQGKRQMRDDGFVVLMLRQCFDTFPVPPLESDQLFGDLYTLRDCLCFCYDYERTKFEFPHMATIEGSANGLLFLHYLLADDEFL